MTAGASGGRRGRSGTIGASRTRQRQRGIKQAARLTDLSRTLAHRHGLSVDDLAGLYGASRRTIYRDLEALEAQGFPIVKESRSDGVVYIRMRPGFSNLPQLTLSLAETISLYVIRAQSHFLSGTNFRADIDLLFERFEKGMSEKDREQLRSFDRKFYPLPDAPKSYEQQIDLLDDLIDALIKQYGVDIIYRPPDGKPKTKHRLHPYTLLTFKEGLYLIARSETAGGIRTFAVDRIESAQVNRGASFEYPEDYSPARYCSGSFGIIRGEPEKVAIRFSPRVATYVSERRYDPSQKLKLSADGSAVLEMTVGVTPELVSWILGFGPDARVLEPETLIARIEEDHRKAAHQYGLPPRGQKG